MFQMKIHIESFIIIIIKYTIYKCIEDIMNEYFYCSFVVYSYAWRLFIINLNTRCLLVHYYESKIE